MGDPFMDDEAQLDFLIERVEALEESRDTLLNEVKDIMTAFENRVLSEIQNLTEARIEPMDKVTSGLMLTIADLTASVTALLDIYVADAPDDFEAVFKKLRQEHLAELLQTMKEAHGLGETKAPKKDTAPSTDGDAKGN